ncbi:hypothetical protein FQA47_003111 [Oryzias melastigma]|uniref:Uncharacterized protein n=1 Tax=Oryzias melastigma TaxID=30732 RepID=A0A834CBF0_ORYME|nr:hypothetical protein FQA47_003111 [Oryzias melastigma]
MLLLFCRQSALCCVDRNSVHSLRKRSSQEGGSQSIFHVSASAWTQPSSADSSNTADAPDEPSIHPPRPPPPPPPVPVPADSAGQESPAPGRASPSLLDRRARRTKTCSSSTMPIRRRDTVSPSSERSSRLQQEKQMLMEEVKAQKELVWILH